MRILISVKKIDSTLIMITIWVKISCVLENLKCDAIVKNKADAIMSACDEIATGNYDD